MPGMAISRKTSRELCLNIFNGRGAFVCRGDILLNRFEHHGQRFGRASTSSTTRIRSRGMVAYFETHVAARRWGGRGAKYHAPASGDEFAPLPGPFAAGFDRATVPLDGRLTKVRPMPNPPWVRSSVAST